MFDHMCEDVHVLNKIIRKLINDSEIVSLVPKVFSRIFSGIWGENSGYEAEMIRNYKSIHSDGRKRKENVKMSVLSND